MAWNIQQINNIHNTDGPPAAADPAVALFNKQQHIAYRDAAGAIWDAWYDPGVNVWKLQKINRGGATDGPAAAAGPFVVQYLEQMHCIYVTNLGEIYDSWYNGADSKWYLQKINNNGVTHGPLATQLNTEDTVFIWTYLTPGPIVSISEQMHCTYLGVDFAIYDAFFDGHGNWILGKINASGNTNGPLAIAGPSVSVFNGQQHFAYADQAGNLWDAWYDGGSHFNLQKINNGGNTNGPAVHAGQGAYSVWLDSSNTQQHFTYLGSDSAVYDAYYDSHSNNWRLEKLNSGGNTAGPKSASAPIGCAFNNQQHIGYRDNAGNIWDAWNDGSGNWNLQKINNGGKTSGGPAAGNVRIWVTEQQQHFTYRDAAGTIWDAFWLTDPPSDLTVTPSSISFMHHFDLSGPQDGNIAGDVYIVMSPDGAWNFSGSLNNSNHIPNNVQIVIFIGYSDPKVGFLWNNQNGIGGNIPTVNNNWSWNNTGNYAEIKNNWAKFQTASWYKYNGTANLDINAMYQGLISGMRDVQQIEQVFGSIVHPNIGGGSGGNPGNTGGQ
jgi:hypothetical protein